MVRYFIVLMIMLFSMNALGQTQPFRIAVAGLTHTHVHWILGRAHDGDIDIVGIAEPDRELAERYLKQHNLPMSLYFASLEEMLSKTSPEAVTAFNSIDEHVKVVRSCAPKKIHVMVEKPLAVSMEHARKPLAVSMEHAREMESLAKKHGIHLLTNYETTWYGSNAAALKKLEGLGAIRKVVVHDGHQGPKEIGVNKEFLEWLTDPVKNGGGAITDFGCYGANLVTWLMKGERPVSVMAVTQQIKPEVYPNVDDEATIILIYPKAQAIIQASWNWPYNRKDMEIYTESGYAIADREGIEFKSGPEIKPEFIKVAAPDKPYHDPFAYLAAVVRKQITVQQSDLSSLQNNMIVMEILEAAKKSAREGKLITLSR
jgi:predicted dehydrogenase